MISQGFLTSRFRPLASGRLYSAISVRSPPTTISFPPLSFQSFPSRPIRPITCALTPEPEPEDDGLSEPEDDGLSDENFNLGMEILKFFVAALVVDGSMRVQYLKESIKNFAMNYTRVDLRSVFVVTLPSAGKAWVVYFYPDTTDAKYEPATDRPRRSIRAVKEGLIKGAVGGAAIQVIGHPSFQSIVPGPIGVAALVFFIGISLIPTTVLVPKHEEASKVPVPKPDEAIGVFLRVGELSLDKEIMDFVKGPLFVKVDLEAVSDIHHLQNQPLVLSLLRDPEAWVFKLDPDQIFFLKEGKEEPHQAKEAEILLRVYINHYKKLAISHDPKFDHIDLVDKHKVMSKCVADEEWLKKKKRRGADVRKRALALDRFCKLVMTKPKPNTSVDS